MADSGGADATWQAAVSAVLEDDDGRDIRRSQGLWALAVRTWSTEEVRCDGDVFGPVLTPGGHVVMRCWAAVRTADPARTRDACDVAWRRFAQVDLEGVEAGPEAEGEFPDPFGYPSIHGDAVILGFDGREDEDPFPRRALTCLGILIEELRRAGCTPARLVNPLRLPDDDGVDVEALADEVEHRAATEG